MKLEPSEGAFLRSQYEDIIPGYYMNKSNWNSIKPDGKVPDDLLKDMLDKSYQLVLSGFSKKKQMEVMERDKTNEDISCCGTDCLTCSCYGSMCKGCNKSEGKVFHAPEGKACPIYECSINQNGFKDCSACKSIPCDIWREARDPSYSDEEFENSIWERVERLKKGQ